MKQFTKFSQLLNKKKVLLKLEMLLTRLFCAADSKNQIKSVLIKKAKEVFCLLNQQ